MEKINYLNDELCKNLFSYDKILINLLNSAFKNFNKQEISQITYEDREINPKFYKGKKSLVDIYVRTPICESFNLEIQKRKIKNFIKRTLRYLIRLADRVGSGDDDGQMFRTVSVNIINFELE